MTDQTEKAKGTGGKDGADFFTVGPPLHAVRAGYIARAADTELYDLITTGQDAYLFAPVRSGKTSLIAATSARLQNNGYLVANLDLAQIGERDAGSDSGRWYYSIAYRLLRQLRIKVDLQSWWQDKSILTSRQRLFEFYVEVLLANTKKPIVVFIDELQAVEGLPFARHLIESITAVNKARATEPEFSRLSFVLSGECDPQLIVPDPDLSPFSMMRPVRLGNFTRESLVPFESELNLSTDAARQAMDRIYYWTCGQPYLTQKIARMLARGGAEDVEARVDRIVAQQFGTRASIRNEPHLAHIHKRVVEDSKTFESSLTIYGRVRKGISVAYDPDSVPQRTLIAVGLIVPRPDGNLGVASPLYELAFTARWANDNLPLHWRGPMVAAGVLALLVAVPFWYTQLLPNPYTRILTSASADYATVTDAYRNLRSFPGHAKAADRLFVSYLESRAALAATEGEISQIAGLTAELPGVPELADRFIAEFWDRRARQALRQEDRDGALMAVLESLIVATPERRRLAGSLLGEDYPLLIGSVQAPAPEQMVFDPAGKLLTVTRGARIDQWRVQAGGLERRPDWSVSALEVTPLLRRVVVDQVSDVSRIGLTINVSHGRLDDIRMRLIAPSGRAIELAFDEARSSTVDETRFSRADLAGLLGEPLAGTWTLSIRDESTDVAGHLVGWRLSLNSQVIEEDFERGLDIPEPVERASDNLWLSSDGRYAIARAEQSDSARLWNLAYASPTRTIAIPANEQVLGLSANADHVLTIDQTAIHVWNAADGRRDGSIEVGAAQDIRLLDDGRRVLLRRSAEAATSFELWDIAAAEAVADIQIAGEPAIVASDRAGRSLAVADYDRAVRIWDVVGGSLIAQLDLPMQPTDIELSPDGQALAVRFGNQGISLWRVERPEQPVLMRRGEDSWAFAFSESGSRFLAGSARRGYQIFSSASGRAIGPPLDAEFSASARQLLGFSDDGNVLLTAHEGGQARFWRFPAAGSALLAADSAADGGARWQWRETEDLVAALSPGGQRVAVGDAQGHVRIFSVDSAPAPVDEELTFIGHRGAISRLAFSRDASLVASVGQDSTIRIWDAVSGLPREYHGSIQSDIVDELRFSPSGRYLAAVLGRQVWVMAVESGEVVVDMDAGEINADLAFDAEDALYLAGAGGTLRQLSADRLGNWTLRNVWRGGDGLRRIGIAPTRKIMVLTDTLNAVHVFDIAAGTIGAGRLELPDRVEDILFAAGEAQVLLRTSRWIHRADISRGGIYWRDAIRAPQAIAGSRLEFDWQRADPPARRFAAADRVLLLTREAGFAEVAELDFSHEQGSLVFGSRIDLLNEWGRKLARERAYLP
jgi:WD40 repeat protein